MRIEMRKLSEIKPYDRNPRINTHAVDAVAASIREFGFKQPIVVDKDGVIIVGHTRYLAALKRGRQYGPDVMPAAGFWHPADPPKREVSGVLLLVGMKLRFLVNP
jgi:hypothetical protein